MGNVAHLIHDHPQYAHDTVDRSIREHPRFAHEAAVTLHTPGRAIGGHTHNVSRGGLCATVSEDVAVGAEIDVDLQLVLEHQHSEPLRVPARIVWCTAIDDYHQVGVQFRALDHDTSEYLTMFLRYLGGRPPPRPARAAASVDERFG
jgi:Tfp pilus assembly protein PilZ